MAISMKIPTRCNWGLTDRAVKGMVLAEKTLPFLKPTVQKPSSKHRRTTPHRLMNSLQTPTSPSLLVPTSTSPVMVARGEPKGAQDTDCIVESLSTVPPIPFELLTADTPQVLETMRQLLAVSTSKVTSTVGRKVSKSERTYTVHHNLHLITFTLITLYGPPVGMFLATLPWPLVRSNFQCRRNDYHWSQSLLSKQVLRLH